jgi:hypothetical protein
VHYPFLERVTGEGSIVFRCLFLGLRPTPPVTLLRAGWVGSSGAVESWRVPPCSGAAAGLLLLACP